jgi:hypothetical protein
VVNDNKKKLIAGAGVALILIGAVAFVLHRRSSPEPAPVAEAPVAPAPLPKPVAPVPPPAPAIPLPELSQSDDFMRGRIKELSADAHLAAWLKTDNILRRLAAATDLISAGKIPTDSLGFLGSRKKFSTVARKGKTVISPKSYARYDAVAAGLASVDAKAVGTLYEQTKPLIQQACQELGDKTCDYRDTFVRAVGELLETPVPSGDVEVALKENGLIYTFADPKLEQLDPVQKELIRMGPDNEQKIQSKLRELAGAIGVSADQLPKAP